METADNVIPLFVSDVALHRERHGGTSEEAGRS
jgi:hypothetical protein